MLRAGTVVKVVESGIKEVRVIRVGKQGDEVLGAVYKGEGKGNLVKGKIIRTVKAKSVGKTGIKVGYPQENTVRIC